MADVGGLIDGWIADMFQTDACGGTVVAMSGGVDSAVSAALLAREGHNVIGVTLQLWAHETGERGRRAPGQSCTAIEDARAVAEHLRIPHVVLDCGPAFERYVTDYFIRAYQDGETPNPCIPCNARLKFGALLQAARNVGAARLATGHYARVAFHAATGRYRLYRAADRRKDQSYFLYTIGQEALAAAQFPLGGLTKTDTRRLARELGLPVADKADSQQVCFAAGDYRAYLRDRLGAAIAPGVIRDVDGEVRGRHDGLPFYTVGQRHGLGIGSPRALYVVALNSRANEVVVGEDRDLWTREADVSAVNLVALERLSEPRRVLAKLRSTQEPQAATATPQSTGGLRLAFEKPQRSVAPGQAAVLYDDGDPDVVLGGGTICRGDDGNAPGAAGAGPVGSCHD